MKWLSCYPSYLKSCGSPLKFSLTGEMELPFLNREKRKSLGKKKSLTGWSVSPFLFPSKITELILLGTMLRLMEIKDLFDGS